MKQRPEHSLLVLCVLAFCVISGCGTSSPNVPVAGHVTVKGGLPVDEGKLVLIPEPPDPKRATCGASIGTDGRFTCTAASGGTGIPPGKYKVVLTFPAGKGRVSPFAEAFKKYTQPDTSLLTVDVPSSGLKDYHIELDEPPAPEEKRSEDSDEKTK